MSKYKCSAYALLGEALTYVIASIIFGSYDCVSWENQFGSISYYDMWSNMAWAFGYLLPAFAISAIATVAITVIVEVVRRKKGK